MGTGAVYSGPRCVPQRTCETKVILYDRVLHRCFKYGRVLAAAFRRSQFSMRNRSMDHQSRLVQSSPYPQFGISDEVWTPRCMSNQSNAESSASHLRYGLGAEISTSNCPRTRTNRRSRSGVETVATAWSNDLGSRYSDSSFCTTRAECSVNRRTRLLRTSSPSFLSARRARKLVAFTIISIRA